MQKPNYLNHFQLLRLKQVVELTNLSKSTIYTLISSGKFPKPVRIGLRAVAWRSSQLANWLAEKGQGGSK